MAELDRIRWRCRRGLLELDLVLAEFLRGDLARLSPGERDTLEQLLDAPDNDLWDWISARSEPADPGARAMVARLRAIRLEA